MKNVKRIITMLLTLALFVALTVPVEAASKRGLKYTEIDVVKGDFLYIEGEYDYISYKSNNSKVCPVNEYGRIYAKKSGSAKITATDAKGNKDTCIVHVFSKSTLKKGLSVTYKTYESYGTERTIVIVKNKSKATYDAKLEIISIDAKDNKHTDTGYIDNFHPGESRAFELSCYAMSTDIKYDFYTADDQQDYCDLISTKIENQDENAFLTVRNNSKYELSVRLDILGYDSFDRIISYHTFYDTMEPKEESYEELSFYSYEYDEDYNPVYHIPERYEVNIEAEQ